MNDKFLQTLFANSGALIVKSQAEDTAGILAQS